MPVALFIAGNFWLVAALAFGFTSEAIQVQPYRYSFLGSTFDSQTYHTFLAMFVAAAAVCFVLSYAAWRRQYPEPVQTTGAPGAFPVIPKSDEGGPGR